MHLLHLIELENVDIFQQLVLEEALLRSEKENFCIVNYGSPKSIVMGISQSPQELLHVEKVKSDNIPVIRRFSGGGTVFIDADTFFVTFIFSKSANVAPHFPEKIMQWTADIFSKAWDIPGFALLENDFIIQDRKCGGNAQYIQKDRFLQHTSFLWNFNSANMGYLSLPEKRPKYRVDRSHAEFLCKLKDFGFVSSQNLKEKLIQELVKRFYIQKFDWEGYSFLPHRQSVTYLEV